MCKIKHVAPENETSARNFEIRMLKFSAGKRCLRNERNVTFFRMIFMFGPSNRKLIFGTDTEYETGNLRLIISEPD